MSAIISQDLRNNLCLANRWCPSFPLAPAPVGVKVNLTKISFVATVFGETSDSECFGMMMEPLTAEKPDTLSNRTSLDFHGYELLLLRKLQSDSALCMEWRDKLQKKIADEDYDLGVSLPSHALSLSDSHYLSDAQLSVTQ